MDKVRKEATSVVQTLLKEYDALPHDAVAEKKEIHRKLLFIMNGVKIHEEESQLCSLTDSARLLR